MSFTMKERRILSQKGLAMPDGGYPIRNRKDLANAIAAYGRGTNKPAVKAWIKKRAKELDLESMLPSNWEPMSQDAFADNEYLAHYGVLGMKWGHRKADSRNANYSDQQYKRDTQIYGKRGAKKINKSMNKGNSISLARGDEKTRRDNVRSKSKYVRQGGKVVGAGVGAVGAYLGAGAVAKKLGSSIVRQRLSKMGGSGLTDAALLASMMLDNPMMKVVAASGAAKVASMFSGDLAVSAYERSHGYNPNRK